MKTAALFNRRNMSLVVGLVLVITLSALAIFGPRGSEARHNNAGATTLSTRIAPTQSNAPNAQQQGPGKNAPTSTENWTGGDSNDANWTSNGNWSGIGGASADDVLIFPVGAARKANNNNFAINTRFHSITISDTNYTISGNQIFLSAGISANATSLAGTNPTFNPNIILDATQTFSATGKVFVLNGVVNMNGHSLLTSGDGSIVFNGSINGSGGLTVNMSGNGGITLNGNAAGFGSTSVNSGSVNLVSPGSLGQVNLSGGTLLGTGTLGVLSAQVNGGTLAPGTGGTNTGILTSTSTVLLNSATTLEINLNGTTAGTQYDRLSAGGNVTLANAALAGTLGFTPSVGQQFTIVQTSAGSITGQFVQGNSIVINGQIFTISYNAQSVVLTAQGSTLTWDGGGADSNWSTAANWSPDAVPADGIDLVFPAGALRKTNNNDIVGLDARSLTITGDNYTLNGNTLNVSSGMTINASGVNGPLINTPITLTQPQTFSNNGPLTCALQGVVNLNGFALTIDGPGHFNFASQIIGSGGLTKNGTGELTFLLGSNSTYSGITQVNSGILEIRNTASLGAIGAGNNTVVASGATLQLESNVTNVPEAISLSGTGVGGTGALTSSGCSTGCSISGAITLAGNGTISVNSGETVTLNGAIGGGAFGLTKVGAGKLILGVSNNYSGATTINAGTLLVNGNNNSTFNLTGGTLGGTGTVDRITATGGTVAPGNNGPGTLTVFTNATFNAATTFNVEIGGTILGTQYDHLGGSAGSLTTNLGGASLTGSLLNGFNPASGTQFNILSADVLTGQFAQGNSVTISGRPFSIAYTATNVVLTAGPGTFTWDGGGADSNWTTAANWVGDTAPQAGDSLVFPAGAARLTNTNNFAAGTNFGSLSFTGNGYTITGNGITLTNGITENGPAGVVVNLNLGLTLAQAQSFAANNSGISFHGAVNLNGNTLTINGIGSINFDPTGLVSGAGGITKNGTGLLSLHSDGSNYTGVTQINAGIVFAFANNALGATGPGNNTVVASGARLDFFGGTPALTVAEAITISGTGVGNFGAIFNNVSDNILTGPITLASGASVGCSSNTTLTINSVINETGGAQALTKIGAGTLILGGANTYTGGTTVSAGTLLVSGSTGNIQLNGGIMGGTGSVGSITGNGTVAPGASAGILNANGNVTFGAATTFNVELNGATVGSQYDRLNVTGSGAVNLGGANLVGSLGGGFNPPDGTQFTVLQTTGTVTGQFAQGQSVSFSGKNFHVVYNSNSVVLTAFTPSVNNVQFSAATYNAGEETFSKAITVTRTGDTSGTSTVDFATSDVGAEQRTDYTIGAGTITFAPGETSKTFDVLLVDDLFVESNETLTLTLSNPTGGAVLGNPSTATLTIAENDSTTPTTNPLDNVDERFFVRQHFYDFLSRLPDPGGFDFWVGQITQCGANQTCLNTKRLDVSNAFFFELEYQQTGSYVFRLYRAAFGNNQPFPSPDNSIPAEALKLPSYSVFAIDRARVVGGANLPSGQLALANAFVQRPEFLAKYPANLDGPGFVDAILATIKNDLGADLTAQRTALINLFNSGGRGLVIYRLADDNAANPINNAAFIDAEYNRAFVATQYFGYLRRDPDIGGFLFWLGQVNSAPLRNVAKQHSMVCSFNTSLEYQFRFSSVATHGNGECPQ